MLEFVEVAMGRGGGVACTRCARPQRADYRQPFDISAEVEAACAGWGVGPGPNVALTGPEPYGHPALPEILASARRAGVSRLRLDTDGTALSSAEAADAAIVAGVRHVRVTLLAGTAADHDGLVGVPGSFDAALACIRGFRAAADRAGVQALVSVDAPLCRHNCHEVPLAFASAAEAGARYGLLRVVDAALDLPSAMPWIGAACDSGTVNCLWVEVAGVPYCLAGSYGLHLTPLMRTLGAGEKGERCGACAADRWCSGLPEGAAPQLKAILAPAGVERGLAEAIERAYLSPGPGEEE